MKTSRTVPFERGVAGLNYQQPRRRRIWPMLLGIIVLFFVIPVTMLDQLERRVRLPKCFFGSRVATRTRRRSQC